MKRISLTIVALLVLALAVSSAFAAVTSSQILSKVKAAEKGFTDFKADLVITEAKKNTVADMGENYDQILKLKKGTVHYKAPDMIRYDGYAEGIKATYIQNGYTKMFTASMIKHKENVKNAPGKRQDSLDLGFLTSKLWEDNYVKVISVDKNGIAKIKFDPKYGDKDKRHDMVWLDVDNLRMVKRQQFRGSGEMRVSVSYGDYESLGGKLPIATASTLYNSKGKLLGKVEYRNLKVNSGLSSSLFSLK